MARRQSQPVTEAAIRPPWSSKARDFQGRHVAQIAAKLAA
jgi:hypothetical protein